MKAFFFSKKNPLGKKKESNILLKERRVERGKPRFSSSKGQYRIVSEILLFAIGLAIASFVVVVFTNLQESITQTSAKDQMLSVSNLISASIIKSIVMSFT